MCANCYQEHFDGREPPPLTEPMRKVASTLRSFSEREPTGGGLHIVTDDWNLEDAHIAACVQAGLTDEEFCIAGHLLRLTEDERYVVMRESGAV